MCLCFRPKVALGKDNVVGKDLVPIMIEVGPSACSDSNRELERVLPLLVDKEGVDSAANSAAVLETLERALAVYDGVSKRFEGSVTDGQFAELRAHVSLHRLLTNYIGAPMDDEPSDKDFSKMVAGVGPHLRAILASEKDAGEHKYISNACAVPLAALTATLSSYICKHGKDKLDSRVKATCTTN